MLMQAVCEQSAIQPDGTCTAVQWVAAPWFLPPLSIAAGAAIAVAILGCWAIAVIYKRL